MAVCRNRSTTIAPDALSSSYFTGVPPTGISMIACRSEGGFRPALILVTSMRGYIHGDLVHQDLCSACGCMFRWSLYPDQECPLRLPLWGRHATLKDAVFPR